MLKTCECWGGEVYRFFSGICTVLIFYSYFMGRRHEFTIYDCLNLQLKYVVCAFYICGCVATISTFGIRCQRAECSFGLVSTAFRIFVEYINYRQSKDW